MYIYICKYTDTKARSQMTPVHHEVVLLHRLQAHGGYPAMLKVVLHHHEVVVLHHLLLLLRRRQEPPPEWHEPGHRRRLPGVFPAAVRHHPGPHPSHSVKPGRNVLCQHLVGLLHVLVHERPC